MQRDLADRARQGDHDAFDALAAASIGRLYSIACLILRTQIEPRTRPRTRSSKPGATSGTA